MRLTDYTDYALRMLMHLGSHPGKIITVREIADAEGVSHNHLTKIAHQLGVLGVIKTLRGRAGGIQLARPPGQIMLGSVIRMTEPDFQMVDCFSAARSTCARAGRCRLKLLLAEATDAYLQRLDHVPLSELLAAPAHGAQPLTFCIKPAHELPLA